LSVPEVFGSALGKLPFAIILQDLKFAHKRASSSMRVSPPSGPIQLSRWSRLGSLRFLCGFLFLFLRLFLGNFMSDDTTGHGARDRMMACHMARHAANDGTLDAALGIGGIATKK
jgi:hypothetical protein